jgi:EAL domain-containing protein (putative c-di-GMP-specific phosphodiesterase class I)
MYYQPIVHLESGVTAGFESLIRWPRPDGTLMMPDAFIPLAEATGQILPLGRWILREATAEAAGWNRARAARGLRPLKVTVNVSAHELHDPSFPATVAEAIAAVDLAPELLVLEATESSLIHRGGAGQANLRALTDRGIRLALDDFGTGYSSLSYLRDLPVTSLKIDKLFVDGIAESERQAALVEGIIGIARSLGLLVVAEGIEREEQRVLLSTMGADHGQGYLFARPMPASAAAVWASGG